MFAYYLFLALVVLLALVTNLAMDHVAKKHKEEREREHMEYIGKVHELHDRSEDEPRTTEE